MLICHESNFLPTRHIAVLALLALMGCAGCAPDTGASSVESASADTYFPIGLGESTLHLQLALTSAEHQKGLMFRKELAQDHGMLFLFERPKKQGFWMKNTRLPLDIGYFNASGKLLEVHKLFPYDETPVASRSHEILVAIETNRDWYANNEISPGTLLDMEALKTAIRQRGFSPSAYALDD